jgi:hypothetical protein
MRMDFINWHNFCELDGIVFFVFSKLTCFLDKLNSKLSDLSRIIVLAQ